MHKYRLICKKGEGTFSEVLKAQCIKNGKYVAIKCMKNHFESIEQVNNLREIQALRRLSPHPNIIKLVEVLYDQPTGRLALVFELMDMNMYELIRGRRTYLSEQRVKHFMYQLIKAMDHMHRNGIFHRDIKPENVLLVDDTVKLADFGSCRGIYSKQPYTEYISTRWYRAPECLLTDGYYNYKMDMWGVGCVFFEIVSLFPLFPGTNELDQIQKIHNILGTPPPELLAKFKRQSSHMDFNFPFKEGTGIAKLIPHASPECVELLQKLLAYNPDDRLSARQAIRHPYFRELREADKRAHSMAVGSPPATSAGDGPSAGLAPAPPDKADKEKEPPPPAKKPSKEKAAAGNDGEKALPHLKKGEAAVVNDPMDTGSETEGQGGKDEQRGGAGHGDDPSLSSSQIEESSGSMMLPHIGGGAAVSQSLTLAPGKGHDKTGGLSLPSIGGGKGIAQAGGGAGGNALLSGLLKAEGKNAAARVGGGAKGASGVQQGAGPSLGGVGVGPGSLGVVGNVGGSVYIGGPYAKKPGMPAVSGVPSSIAKKQSTQSIPQLDDDGDDGAGRGGRKYVSPYSQKYIKARTGNLAPIASQS
eukprot:tig00000073_g1718.t1